MNARATTLLAFIAAFVATRARGSVAEEPPSGALAGAGIDQPLGAPLPLNLAFRDEDGRELRLGSLFQGKPVVLSFAYFSCPMLCSYVLHGEARALRAMSLEAGRDFALVTVSFNPHDTAAAAAADRREYEKLYARDGAAWHFLTGDEPAIAALTRAVGFRYERDASSGQFAHAAGLMVLTPDGRLARTLFGIEFSPRDLRLALVEASNGRIGSPVDSVLLYCFHYDPRTGRYGPLVLHLLQGAGAVTVLGLGGLILTLRRREPQSVPGQERPL